jgi:hypothetical protein
LSELLDAISKDVEEREEQLSGCGWELASCPEAKRVEKASGACCWS